MSNVLLIGLKNWGRLFTDIIGLINMTTPVKDPQLLEKLQEIHSGTTRGQLGCLPLFIGMLVLVSQNFDVEGGIVNGSYSIVKQI